jgi:hypothetical protein
MLGVGILEVGEDGQVFNPQPRLAGGKLGSTSTPLAELVPMLE